MYIVARFSKALAALGGSLLAVLVAFGVDLTPEQTGALTTLLTTLAVIVAPANAPKEATPGPATPTATDVGKPMQEPEPFVGDPERMPNA